MRTRDIHIQVWLDRKEFNALNENVQKTGLSRSNYLRFLINGYVPGPLPSIDYWDMRQELFKMGNTLEELIRAVRACGNMDMTKLEMIREEWSHIVQELRCAMERHTPMGMDAPEYRLRGETK